MTCRISGAGWVTPLGCNVAEVWQKLCAGQTAPIETLTNEKNGARYLVRRVSVDTITNLPPHPRLRRASAISRFAAAAGLGALEAAETKIDPQRTALVFAISNGGVIYTRRFYDGIVEGGAQAASPLLFPETVFNAPASHLAAILGITGASYTVVGDGAVGILALKLAENLIAAAEADFVLVVGAEELDSLACEAYRRWRLLRNPEDPSSLRGMVLSEGAGALLLTHEGSGPALEKIDAGFTWFRRSTLAAKMKTVAKRLGDATAWITSGNGTFIDTAEAEALPARVPHWSPKTALGDSVGASVPWQVIVAIQALRTGQFPTTTELIPSQLIGVLSAGMNQQLGGLLLDSADES